MVRSALDSGNSESSAQACYISEGHANNTSLSFWKTSPALTLQLWERSPVLNFTWPHSVISTEHRPLTMELGLSWIFLVAIFKGDLQRTRNLECVSRHEWEEKCDTFLTMILCVCRCSVWGAAGWIWGRLGAAWRGSETLVCSLWIHLQ
jgi:hypothetical protein